MKTMALPSGRTLTWEESADWYTGKTCKVLTRGGRKIDQRGGSGEINSLFKLAIRITWRRALQNNERNANYFRALQIELFDALDIMHREYAANLREEAGK